MTGPTETPPELRYFNDALTPHVRNQLHLTQAVVSAIHRAIREHGWTPQQLATEVCRNTEGVANAGGLATYRLQQAAEHAPPTKPTPHGEARPWCSDDCRERGGWIEDPATGQITGRCPCRLPAPLAELTAADPITLRDQGMAAAAEAHPSALDAAYKVICDAAAAHDVLSANTVRPLMEHAGIAGEHAPLRAVAFRRAVREGILEPLDEDETSRDPGTHGKPVQKYRSCRRQVSA